MRVPHSPLTRALRENRAPERVNARLVSSPSGRREFAYRFVRLSKRGGYANRLKGSDKEFQLTLKA